MKKASLIAIVILTATNALLGQEELHLARQTRKESKYWSFIKQRLFDGETAEVYPFQNDILIELKGATKEDSLIVNNLIQELRILIPNKKIEYRKGEGDLRKIAFSIGFNDTRIMSLSYYLHHTDKINGNQIHYRGVRKKTSQYDYSTQHIHLTFNDTISFPERKRYIDYAIVRPLCTIKGNPLDATTFIKGAIFNSFAYNPYNTNFTDADKFLIKKLNEKDFQEQFKKFMVDRYSWQYYMHFTHREHLESYADAVSIIIAIIIFIIFYKPVFRRNYRNKYLGYLMPGLVVAVTMGLIKVVTYLLTSPVGVATLVSGSSYSYFLRAIFFALLFAALTGVMVVVASALLYFIEKWLIKPRMHSSTQLVVKVVLFLVVFIVFSGSFRAFPDGAVNINLFFIGLTLALGRGALLFLNSVSDSLVRQKDVELSRLRESAAKAEIRSLQARINPHFLYNSLNSIAGLARSNPDKTEKMALSLSDLFRHSINRNGDQMSSIRDEVAMVRSYLEIEQIRFGDRMSFNIQIDPGTEDHLIPRFILQPLVENAIKHGISKIEGKGEITLSIHKTEDDLMITVTDNGPGFPEGLVSGYGLQSLYDLLKLTYGGHAEVNWQNDPEKKIWVKIKTIAVHNKYEHTSL